jgi:methionine sulfoxide reductase heme-binding subunit
MWMYFLRRLHPPALQNTLFGFANYIGAAAALLVILGAHPLQQCRDPRPGFAAQEVPAALDLCRLRPDGSHGIAFQLVEKRHLPWVFVFGAPVAAVVRLQLAWFLRMRNMSQSGR